MSIREQALQSNPSAVALGVLFIAYFIFTTNKGNLPVWLEIVGLRNRQGIAP